MRHNNPLSRVAATQRQLWLAVLAAVAPLALTTPHAYAAQPAGLTAFKACGDLLDFARKGVVRGLSVPPQAGTWATGGIYLREKPPPPGSMPRARPASAPDAGTGATEFSNTNTQEAGVDEPDLVKTDGRRMFVVVGKHLWALDVTTPTPTVLSKLSLENVDGQLLVYGNRALLIGMAPASVEEKFAAGRFEDPRTRTRLSEIDVSNPAAMKIVRVMTIPGRHVNSRLSDGTARIVVQSAPVLPRELDPSFRLPKPLNRRARRARAGKLKSDAFIPQSTLRSRVGGKTYRRPLVACSSVHHPARFSGLDLTTVLSVNLRRGLVNVDRDTVMAAAQVVYGSPKSLYIASRPAVVISRGKAPRGVTSEIHRFDASMPEKTTYAASGSVPGFALNQYSLSEFGGVLRVATTTEPPNPQLRGRIKSESTISILRQRGSKLTTIGKVGGLGKSERIYAARFIGDRGYLVTWRQYDPLYTLDLSVPKAPRVAGVLKIPGYSSYLYPIGEHLLLGLGQDATPGGRLLGSQASIFDVRDAANPVRVAHRVLGSYSPAEQDPHTFAWWAPGSMAIVPLYGRNGGAKFESGALAFTANPEAALADAGWITHKPLAEGAGGVQRSVIVGDRVLTISDAGIASSALSGFGLHGFVPFPYQDTPTQ